ncbi:MAG: 4'-phosphopantetheinyl transferase superfamily protein [Methanoregulaceae archaeon]|nr:MAG: 4'-phosphopantetheinyl transferase superfamily protein [Methanoregulaceae archaeon]
MNGFVSMTDSLKVRSFMTGESVVPAQGTHIPIKAGTVHVWSARYSTLERYYSILSAHVTPEEIQRAQGFRKQNDARQYILRHGMVRSVLGKYLHKDPQKIQFVQNVNGKPELSTEGPVADIRFSMSRTNERVCLGITRKSAIGLDLVKNLSGYPFSAVGHHLFTPGERLWIAQEVPGRRSGRFFRIWALKEAVLKATGSSARMMQEADLANIMTDTYLDGWYPVLKGKSEMLFFIHESGCGSGHHRVIAVTEWSNRTCLNGEPDTGPGNCFTCL